MPDRESLMLLEEVIRRSIDCAQRSADANPDAQRLFRSVLALLWSAYDELEALERIDPNRRHQPRDLVERTESGPG